MVYGGWTTPKYMLSAYVEESKLLSTAESGFYAWLVTDLPHRTLEMTAVAAPAHFKYKKMRCLDAC